MLFRRFAVSEFTSPESATNLMRCWMRVFETDELTLEWLPLAILRELAGIGWNIGESFYKASQG